MGAEFPEQEKHNSGRQELSPQKEELGHRREGSEATAFAGDTAQGRERGRNTQGLLSAFSQSPGIPPGSSNTEVSGFQRSVLSGAQQGSSQHWV